MQINPTEVQGAWRRGWTLDVHTTSSEFLGYDAAGHAQFSTTRSPLGELVYQLKYRGESRCGDEIAATMARFFDNKPNTLARIDLVVPVPPSTVRQVQPVASIAAALSGKLGKPFAPDAIRKTRETPSLKEIYDPEERRELLDGAYDAGARVHGRGVLLVDDLYRSGATANAVTLALIGAGASRVYLLAATRTRSKV